MQGTSQTTAFAVFSVVQERRVDAIRYSAFLAFEDQFVQHNELTDTARGLARSSSMLIPENFQGEASVGDASAIVGACNFHLIGASLFIL